MTEDIPARAARIQRELFGTEPPEPSVRTFTDADYPIESDHDPEWSHRGLMVDAYGKKHSRLVNKNDRNRDSIEGVVEGIKSDLAALISYNTTLRARLRELAEKVNPNPCADRGANFRMVDGECLETNPYHSPGVSAEAPVSKDLKKSRDCGNPKCAYQGRRHEHTPSGGIIGWE